MADVKTHDGRGKFAPGNKLGGRKSRGLSEFRDALRKVEGDNGLKTMAQLLFDKAKSSDDNGWFKLYLEYRFGKPAQAIVADDGAGGSGTFRVKLVVDAEPEEDEGDDAVDDV